MGDSTNDIPWDFPSNTSDGNLEESVSTNVSVFSFEASFDEIESVKMQKSIPCEIDANTQVNGQGSSMVTQNDNISLILSDGNSVHQHDILDQNNSSAQLDTLAQNPLLQNSATQNPLLNSTSMQDSLLGTINKQNSALSDFLEASQQESRADGNAGVEREGEDSDEEADDPTEITAIGEEMIPYVTRGAELECSLGSHTRKLDLAKDHGMRFSITDENGNMHPIMIASDCILEKDDPINANIKFFGVCNSSKPPSTETIHLKGQNGGKVVSGKACDLCIISKKWEKSTLSYNVNGAEPITIDSELYCERLGRITIKTSGIEYEDN